MGKDGVWEDDDGVAMDGVDTEFDNEKYSCVSPSSPCWVVMSNLMGDEDSYAALLSDDSDDDVELLIIVIYEIHILYGIIYGILDLLW